MDVENFQDIDLINRVIDGECELFEHIVVRYRRLCMSYIYRMVRNQSDSEDLLQETFMRAFTCLSQFTAKGKFSSWLLKIAHNLCMSFFNKRNSYRIDSNVEIDKIGDLDLQGKAGLDSNPLNIRIRSEFINHVNSTISELPPSHKSCIMLRYMIDLSYSDISDILDIPIGTVKSRIAEARKKIKGSVCKYGM